MGRHSAIAAFLQRDCKRPSSMRASRCALRHRAHASIEPLAERAAAGVACRCRRPPESQAEHGSRSSDGPRWLRGAGERGGILANSREAEQRFIFLAAFRSGIPGRHVRNRPATQQSPQGGVADGERAGPGGRSAAGKRRPPDRKASCAQRRARQGIPAEQPGSGPALCAAAANGYGAVIGDQAARHPGHPVRRCAAGRSPTVQPAPG